MKALYYGDNLQGIRYSIATESVDLIYLDPPFNSNATYNVLFRSRKGEETARPSHPRLCPVPIQKRSPIWCAHHFAS